MTEFLIEAIQYTSGWVIVTVFALYVGLEIFRAYNSGRNARVAILTIRDSIEVILKDIKHEMQSMTRRLEDLNRNNESNSSIIYRINLGCSSSF